MFWIIVSGANVNIRYKICRLLQTDCFMLHVGRVRSQNYGLSLRVITVGEESETVSVLHPIRCVLRSAPQPIKGLIVITPDV